MNEHQFSGGPDKNPPTPLFPTPWTDLFTPMMIAVPGDNLHASFFSVRREQNLVESGISLDVIHKFDQLGHGDTRLFGTAN